MASNGCIAFALTAVIAAGFLITVGDCLHCWECNSKYDPNCGEPFKNHTIALADCSQRFLPQNDELKSTICRKITQIVRGETRIVRSCGFINPEDAGECVARAGTHLVFMHYCQCAEEGCNHAGGLMPSSLAIFLHLFTSFLIYNSIFS